MGSLIVTYFVQLCYVVVFLLVFECLSFYSFAFFTCVSPLVYFFFFFLNDRAPTEISPLPLHDALPIYGRCPCSATPSASHPPVSTPGASVPRVPSSNAATPSWWRSAPSTPRSRNATAARASTPSWRTAVSRAASTRSLS